MSSKDVSKLRGLSVDLDGVARRLRNGDLDSDRAARLIRDIAIDIEQLAGKWMRDVRP